VVGMKNVSHLFYLFVDRAYQRRGLGRELWDIAKAKTRGIGYPGPFTVNASVNAVPAYLKLGFREVGPKAQVHGVAFVPMQSGNEHAA
jgi:GNAT superfamily N-acetyltransferase